MEHGAALHFDRRARVVRQHEHRRVERRVRPPPTPPLVVGADIGPRAGLRTELAPAHDLRTEPDLNPFGERMVDTDGAAGIANHRAPEAGGEIPLVQAMAGVAERGVERDAAPVPNPSREIEKLWTRTWDIAASEALGDCNMQLVDANAERSPGAYPSNKC